MGTDFTERLRRALVQRHTPEGRGFFAAVLRAVSHGDAEPSVPLSVLLADPAGVRSPSLDAWLIQVAGAVGVDAQQTLAHRDQVGTALAALSCRPSRTGSAARTRVRNALRLAAEAG